MRIKRFNGYDDGSEDRSRRYKLDLQKVYKKYKRYKRREYILNSILYMIVQGKGTIIDDFLYSSGQGAKSPELYMVLPGADGTDDEVKDTISQLLSKNEYIEIIAKDNKTYLDSKKYNL